nr:hypothetical protein [Tanacetum cinerariifolium]
LREDYGFVATVDREIMRDSKREVGYGITGSWDEIVETLQGAPISTDMELGGYVREFETRVRQDTDEIYMRLDDEQTERQLLAGRLNMLFRDRRAHAYTRHLMETEARMSREAWVRATDTSDLVHGEVMSLRTTVLGVTYTGISSPFEELSDIGSPRADGHEHLMLPEMLEDLYTEDDDNEDPEEDPVDYHADGGDDGDDEEESSENDEDDDMDIESDEEEEEEHPAPADSVVVAPTAADQAPSA